MFYHSSVCNNNSQLPIAVASIPINPSFFTIEQKKWPPYPNPSMRVTVATRRRRLSPPLSSINSPTHRQSDPLNKRRHAHDPRDAFLEVRNVSARRAANAFGNDSTRSRISMAKKGPQRLSHLATPAAS